MNVVIPLFEGMTMLDAVGPYEVLSRLPGAKVTTVAAQPGPVRNDMKSLAVVADAALGDVDAADILVVPGGIATRALIHDRPLIDWIAAVHPTTTWTTSVCTGSLLLGAAGVLRGLEATTHWMELERLREFGAVPSSERVVVQGKVVTAAGVSAGIDMPSRWPRWSQARPWPRPSSCRSSTTRTRRSARAAPPPPRRRWSSWCGASAAGGPRPPPPAPNRRWGRSSGPSSRAPTCGRRGRGTSGCT